MGFGLLIAGFVLLFNPVIHVADVLPDAIGFFLIVAGLTKMSYFIDKIAQARTRFLQLAFVEVAKFFSIAFIPYTSGSAQILLAFVFGCAELLLFFPAIFDLFEGLSFAGLWYNGTAIYAKKSVKKRKWMVETDKNGKKKRVRKTKITDIEWLTHLRKFILFFYTFRVCSTIVPELTELQMYDHVGEVKTLQWRATYYKPFLYVVFGIAVAIIGLVYIRKVAAYFGAIRKEQPFIDALTKKYTEEILPRDTFFIAVRMKRALLLFSLSCAASLMVNIDGVNFLVGIISSALLISAVLIVRKYVKLANVVIPIAVLRSVLSIINFVQQIRYFSEYSVEAVEWIETAYNQYYSLTVMECIEYIVALASVLLFLTALMQAVKAHLEVCGIQTENAMFSKRNRDLETYNAVGGKLLLCSILVILQYSFYCAYHYLIPSMTLISVLAIAVALISIAYCIYTANAICEMLYDKEIEMN